MNLHVLEMQLEEVTSSSTTSTNLLPSTWNSRESIQRDWVCERHAVLPLAQ